MDETPTKSNIQKQLEATTVFMATSAYRSYLHTQNTDLSGVEQSILATPPDTELNRSAQLQLFGRRTELLAAVTFFEDAQTRLKNLLDEIIEQEANQKSDNEKQND